MMLVSKRCVATHRDLTAKSGLASKVGFVSCRSYSRCVGGALFRPESHNKKPTPIASLRKQSLMFFTPE